MRSHRRNRWAAAVLAGAVTLIATGCTAEQQMGFLPGDPGTTNHTEGIVGLWVNGWIVLLIVGIVTWGLILWSMLVYRRRRGQTGLPVQLRYNMPIEIFYTIVPFILVLGFFAATVREQVKIEAYDASPEVHLEVFGKQWAWDTNYVNENVYSPGVQARHPAGQQIDTTDIPKIYLPVGKSVRIDLLTRDVVHSFWVVEFLYKKDMIPFQTNSMSFVPQIEGVYTGKCAELCGQYHSLMLFELHVVSEAEYARQIEALRSAGYEGQLSNEYDRLQNTPGGEQAALSSH